MNQFGFGDYTGIDIKEETRANMPTRQWKMDRYKVPWYKGDTIPVGIGQGYWTATPLQIAKATTVILNKGKVNTPHLLYEIVDDKLKIAPNLRVFPPIVNVKNSHWVTVLNGMRLANHGKKGTAKAVFENSPYVTGGKSGTAQVFSLKEDQEYKADDLSEHLRDHALYTGFAPFKDPKVVVSVVIENAGGGSSNGAPIAQKIFNHVLGYKNTINDDKDSRE